MGEAFLFGACVVVAVALAVTEGLDDPRLLPGALVLPFFLALFVLIVRTKVRRRIRSTAAVGSRHPATSPGTALSCRTAGTSQRCVLS